jgi:flagellar hook-associated protein 1 FlgK
MSLSVALSSSISSILVLEKQMGVASNNVSNAGTTGYSTETEQVTEQVSGGVGAGVLDLGTTSDVNQYMLSAVVQGNATSGSDTAYNTLYQELQTALGQLTTSDTGGNDISSQLSTIQSDLSTLSTTPSNVATRTQVVSDLDNLLSNLRSMSTQIQSLRTTADSQIGDAVADANTQLKAIQSLNGQIALAQVNNQSTAALADQRNTALESLSSDLGVSYYIDSNGTMQIYTAAGQPLLQGTTLNALSYTPSQISAGDSYANGGISGIMVGNADITDQVSTGKIAGLVAMRDTELPNAQNALDSLAQSLTTTVNTIYNQGTTVPPPTILQTPANLGNYSLTDPVTVASGTTLAIATMDSSGNAQNYTTVNLSSSDATLQDVVNDINSQDTAVTASISGGRFSLVSNTTGQTIGLTTLSGGISAPGSSTVTNLSAFFHLNDLIVNGTSATDIAVQPSILKTPGLFSTATVGSTGVGSGDGSIATNLGNAFLGDQSFTSNTSTGTAAVSNLTTPLGIAGTFTISGGNGPISVTVTSTMSLTDIMNAVMAAAGSSGVTASIVGSGSYQLRVCSNGSAVGFQNVSGDALASLGLTSSPSGYQGAGEETFAQYASNIVSDIATRASAAATQQTTSTTTLTALQSNLSAQSGVNTDQQMAEITALQNAYAASAKVISTVNAMFQALLTAVGA